MKPTATVIKIVLLVVLGCNLSCALKAIPSDYTATRLPTIDMGSLGNGTILIYNGADILHGMDNTARLNIWIGEKAMGQIRKKEYTILQLENGTYDFNVLHIDMFNMRSKHSVEIDENTKVIRIEPTVTSNKLTVTNELPTNFAKYTHVLDRK
jgi:hypothetical protein